MGRDGGFFAPCLHIFSRRRRLQRKQASSVCDFLQRIWKRISIYKCLVKLLQKRFFCGFEASLEKEGMEEARKKMKGKQKDEDKASLREQSRREVPSARRTFNRLDSWSRYVEGSMGCELLVSVSALEVEFAVDLSQLFLGQKFASGAYSRLYHGIYKNKAVAVKLIAPPEEDRQLSSRLDRQFSQEVAILSRLRHRHVIEFVGACKKPPIYCVITEYLPGGSLMIFLRKSKPHSLPMKLVTRIALDVARGMEYLHSQGVIHRDLKSDNLLMTDDFHIKIADFGVSCLETHRENMKGFMGTYRWMAPEMIEEKTCSRKVDVYSFGIVLWELCTGLIPFGEMTPVQAAFAICQEKARPSIPVHCSEEIADLMQLCWCSNPTNRPEFSQIVQILQSFNEV